MANTLRFKRGLVAGIPTALAGEPLFTTDTFDLYIGNGTTNTRFQKYIASGTTAQYLRGDGSLATFPTNIITGTGVSGQVAYWSGTNTQAGSNNLFWDDANIRLGVGRTPSARRFEIQQAIGSVAASIGLYSGGGSLRSIIGIESVSTDDLQIASATGLRFYTGSTLGNIVTNPTNERMRLYSATGNLAIGGTFASDLGQRLQVTGDTLLKGSGNTSATTALTVQNSDGTAILNVRNDRFAIFGTSALPSGVNLGAALRIYQTNNSTTENQANQDGYFIGSTGSTNSTYSKLWLGFTPATGFNSTSGNPRIVTIQGSFIPTSGTATFGSLALENTINQTGGANGITRGLYVNPTLTAADDWRSIEWSNNTGWGLYGDGGASNFLSGKLGIGSTTLTANTLRISRAQTGATSINTILSSGQINSDVTASVNNFASQLLTQAATFTLGSFSHFRASDTIKGAGSTITNEFGFNVDDLTFGTNNYGFYGNIAAATNRWNFYAAGSAANYFNGNTIMGTLAADSGERLQVNGTMKVTGASTFGGDMTYSRNINAVNNFTISNTTVGTAAQSRLTLTAGTSGSGIIAKVTSSYSAYKISQINDFNITNVTSGDIAILNDFASGSIKMAAGGSSTAQFTIASTGAATFSSNVTSAGNFLLTNGNAGTIGAMNLIRTNTSPVASRLTFGTDGTGYSFVIGKNQAGTVTDFINLNDSGNFGIGISPLYKLDVTGEARVSSAIAIGTTPDTNKPFKILKNINGTVGINFENTSTSSLAFSAIQMGTDVTGGTKFTNLVYASSGVAASGVYNPDGTSLINNGGGGLNFLGTPTRFYTGGANGVLRLLHDNEGTTQFTATTPTTNATDGYKQYSADVVAGNAAPHFRTENGAVIKLYQETTGVGNAIISLGGGSAVLDDTTFDGYTLRQIVKALRNQGILA